VAFGPLLDEWPTIDRADRDRLIEIAYTAALRGKDLEPDPTVVRRLDELIASVAH